MADGTIDGRSASRPVALWTELFRVFQVALDLKKILLAAVGILATGAVWYVLSAIAYSVSSKPDLNSADYAFEKFGGADSQKAHVLRQQRFNADLDAWKVLHQAAGPQDVIDKDAGRGGSLRSLPWFEDRGPNPFLVCMNLFTSNAPVGERFSNVGWSVGMQAKVVLEPVVKFLRPIVYLFKPGASVGIRFYLLGILISALAIWSFIGGMITRLAAVELAGKDPLSLRECFRYVCTRYVTYISAPLLPLVGCGCIVLFQIVFGWFHLIPWLGDIVVDGVGFPLMLLAGIAQALLLVGLLGYPLIFATISAEGSDTFDAVSRTFSYVYTAFWHFLWYTLVAAAYGAALVFFVGFLGSLMVYLAKWGMDQTPGTTYFDRKPEYLFVYAPTSFGWRDLLLQGSPAVDAAGNINPELYNRYIDGYVEPTKNEVVYQPFTWANKTGAFLVAVWLALALLGIVGFAYSYFWVASMQVYLLLRRKVDDTDLDEVYLEDETPEDPFAQPKSAPTSLAAAVSNTAVTMVDAPALRSAPPPVEAPATPPAEPPRTGGAE